LAAGSARFDKNDADHKDILVQQGKTYAGVNELLVKLGFRDPCEEIDK